MATVERGEQPSWLDLIKRILVGRRMESRRLEHTLLPKVLALPVFSSDALSSVAYATEEILRVLLVAGAAAATFGMAVSFRIATLLVIVVGSFPHTVWAYPPRGGADNVTKGHPWAVP